MAEDKIIKKLLDHDDEFVKIRKEIEDNHSEVLERLDSIMVIIQRLDQERLFTFETVKRLQNDLDKVKKVLKMT